MLKWMHERGLLTAIIVIFLMWLVGYPTYMMFSDITTITTAAASSYGVLIGAPILTLAVGLFKARIGMKDD